MIAREFTAERINAVINDPAVRPFAGDPEDGRIDMSDIVADDRNVLLMGAHGGTVFRFIYPGLYEGHAQALPEGRGAWMRQASEECVQWMFLRTPCTEIVTRCRVGNLAAKSLALAIGMRQEYIVPNGSRWANHPADLNVLSLPLGRWVLDNVHLESAADWFVASTGVELGDLGHDDPHMRTLGAAAAMFSAGQVEKGVRTYARWAATARQPAILLSGDSPPLMRFRGVVFAMRGTSIEVINQC